MLAGAYLLAAPTFRATASPPHPWGIWVGSSNIGGGALLALELDATKGCGAPVTAVAKLRLATGGTRAGVEREVRRPLPPSATLRVGLAGVRVVSGAFRGSALEAWKPMRIVPFRDIAILEGTRGAAQDDSPEAEDSESEPEVRFLVDATQSAGFEACYMTSPALFELQGDEPYWEPASQANIYAQERGLPSHEWEASDGIVWMHVAHMDPDPSSLQVHAQVRRDKTLVTCSAVLAPESAGDRSDPFFNLRSLTEESACGSVQTFRASDATEDLTLRSFLAGILVSAALGILIEALVTGQIETKPGAA
jgi:hypothetical protein